MTQQLIKELLLSKEKTWTRKLKEIVLSVQLNSHIE
ncbi:MAG: transglycosylase domain-containing protein [Patescibacteria group bacterium]